MIKLFYPSLNDIEKEFIQFNNFQFNKYKTITFYRHRYIEFSLDELININSLLLVKHKFTLFDICDLIGLSVHIDYQELINKKKINCGFLQGLNFLYHIYKADLQNKKINIKIDLPEINLHPLALNALFNHFIDCNWIKNICVFTYNQYLAHKFI